MNALPHIAMINSFAGFGRISSTAALPVMNTLRVKVSTMPSAVLSSHLGYNPCIVQDCTTYMEDCYKAWAELGLIFDGIYCGYLCNSTQIQIVQDFLNSKLCTSTTKILIDPVMGDHGKAYSTVTSDHISKMKKLIQSAHIMTPNLTEACMLTDYPYKEGVWTETELIALCSCLDENRKKQIVITGIPMEDNLQNVIWDRGVLTIHTFPKTGSSRPGTGDIFAAILAALSCRQIDFKKAVQKATDFISVCIADSEKAGLPIKEGILYETNLSRLTSIS